MPKHLSEEQAWRVLAEKFAGRTGFCRALRALHIAGLISEATLERMEKQIDKEWLRRCGHIGGGYLWPLPATYVPADEPRVKFALHTARAAARKSRRKGRQ